MIKLYKGESFFVKVDTNKDEFNLDPTTFICKYVNDLDNTIISNTNPFSEIVESITSPRTATCTISAVVGERSININTKDTLQDGDVFQDTNGNVYYIKSKSTSIITLNKPIIQNISVGDVLTQVGNTGIYKVEFTLDTVGSYTIMIENPTVDMSSKSLGVIIVEDNTKFKGFI